jgi:hypothetical protein
LVWSAQERQAIRDTTDFLRTRVRSDEFTLERDGVDPNPVILGLIGLADYAIDIAADATSCTRAERINRIILTAGFEEDPTV